MNLITGDLWDELHEDGTPRHGCDLLLFPANRILDAQGHLVMGAGVALQFKERFPLLPTVMGKRLKNCGNFYGVATAVWKPHPQYRIGAFQTKYDWRGKSPLDLVRRSTEKLALNANQFNRIVMPMPGVGLGGLKEIDVMPLLETLPNNVFVYRKS